MSGPIKISGGGLPSATALGGTEVVAGVQGSSGTYGGTVEILISQIATYVRTIFTTTPVTIAEGGTGSATAAAARTALDVPSNSEAILDTIVDSVGDWIVATAADTPVRADFDPDVNNGSFTATASAGALTITLVGPNGSAPAATNPIVVGFGSNLPAAALAVTSAQTLVIPSTATLGAANSVPLRVWVTEWNDGGTYRLGVFNALSPTTWEIHELTEAWQFGTTTISTGSDSAGVHYTGTAVTGTKAFRILGCIEWDSGLSTAGTWTTPTRSHVYTKGSRLPGDVIQVEQSQSGAVATGTTVMPIDDTIPQITEGDQYMSLAFNPVTKMNLLRIRHVGVYASSNTDSEIGVALFQDTTAGALAAVASGRSAAAGAMSNAVLDYVMQAGTVSATTLRVRAGTASAGTTTFNGTAGGRIFGGVMLSSLIVEEIQT